MLFAWNKTSQLYCAASTGIAVQSTQLLLEQIGNSFSARQARPMGVAELHFKLLTTKKKEIKELFEALFFLAGSDVVDYYPLSNTLRHASQWKKKKVKLKMKGKKTTFTRVRRTIRLNRLQHSIRTVTCLVLYLLDISLRLTCWPSVYFCTGETHYGL